MRTTIIPSLSLALALTLLGCSDSNKVVLKSSDGKRQLVYDIRNFRPQAETAEDMGILFQEAGQAWQDAAQANAFVSVTEIQAAMERATTKNDWRGLERVVVFYRASHRK